MFRREVPANEKTRRGTSALRAKSLIRVAQHVQALLRRDPREEPDGKWIDTIVMTRRIPLQIDSEWRNRHFRGGHAEVARHEVSVVRAHGQKHVDVPRRRTNQIERLRSR